MEDSGAILCQLSFLKDMLDQVNVEIEENIQLTREIESEIVKCSEIESGLALIESESMKKVYESEFEITGLKAVTANLRASVEVMENVLGCLETEKNQLLDRMNIKREGFTSKCLNFQREINMDETDELKALSIEKECLQNELTLLERKTSACGNSMLAFVEEILEDLYTSNSALSIEIQTRNCENDKVQKDIDELKTTLIAVISANAENWENKLLMQKLLGQRL